MSSGRRLAFVVLLLVAAMGLGAKFAHAASGHFALVCAQSGVSSGAPYSECLSGNWQSGDFDALVPGDLVLACHAPVVGDASCGDAGGAPAWVAWPAAGADAVTEVLPESVNSWVSLSTALGWAGGGDDGGDGDGEECEPFTLACVDTALSTQAFSAGFILVALFWGMGKGIELVLGVVRRS